MQDFHKLRAWSEASNLAIKIRRLTSRFPKSDYGTLRNQMIRAAESIADNIAEGCGAATAAEFARYLDMAIKSSSELESQIDRCRDYGLTRDREHQDLAIQVCDVRKMTWGLRKKVLASPQRPRHGQRSTENGLRVGEHKTNNG
ncbi:MAG: four helix bundle protein [Gemmatimonadaceae bacterium]